MNLGRTQTALGAFYRRLAFRVGKAKAITATARASSLPSSIEPRERGSFTPILAPTRTTRNTGCTSSAAYGSAPHISGFDLVDSRDRRARRGDSFLGDGASTFSRRHVTAAAGIG